MTSAQDKPALALTFEAAGEPGPTDPILLELQRAGVRATFFLDGSWVKANPDLVKRIASEGHELGNHGYDHPDWTGLGSEEIVADLESTEELVRNLTGEDVKPWARPPFGAMDDRVLEVLNAAGYHAVYRDAVDGAHWPGETSVESVHARSLQCAVGGGVIVYHTNRFETAEALPRIIADLMNQGYRLITLSELDSVPSRRLERHPDFAELTIAPGYLHPRVGGRWQRFNLLELGASLRQVANRRNEIAECGGATFELVTGDRSVASGWTDAEEDAYILVLVGEMRADFRTDDQRDGGYIIARRGDMFRCPRGFSYRLGPSEARERRWIAVIWRSDRAPSQTQ